MNSENKHNFQLKWPWNWVLCGLFILGTWRFLGIFSILIAALFFYFQKKRHPDAVPQGGYCLDRTRKRMARLGWSLLYLIIAFCCGMVFFMSFREDRSSWELEDWVMLIGSGAISLGASLLCVYETYTDLRDVFCPSKSQLAKSIRSQLPYPDESPELTELFDMVDRDIKENGIFFDRVAIGHEWVLGDEAMSIPRIRGVFHRDEIKTHTTSNRQQTTRIIQLWLVDDRKQLQYTDFRHPNELDMAVTCLRQRTPEAFFADYNKLSGFIDKTEEDWLSMERDFRTRRDQRLSQETESVWESDPTDRPSVATNSQATAQLARKIAAEQFAALKEQLKTSNK